MDFAQRRLDNAADAQHERAAHVRLESEIALVRQEIARLKARLKLSFEEPGGFVAIGDELRHATERLRLMEAELKTRKLDAREEVWWSSSRPVAAGAATLPRSANRYSERRPH
jgi:hypothetical protein